MTSPYKELKDAFMGYFIQRYHYKKEAKGQFNEGGGRVYDAIIVQ